MDDRPFKSSNQIKMSLMDDFLKADACKFHRKDDREEVLGYDQRDHEIPTAVGVKKQVVVSDQFNHQ